MLNKSLAALVMVLFLIISMIPNVVSDTSTNRIIYVDDNVEVKIYAGVYDKTNGDIGLGFVISIANNLDTEIFCNINITSYNLQDKLVRFESWDFYQNLNYTVIFSFVDWIHFPYTIITTIITVYVETIDLTVSRTGLEIGPIMIFKPLN